MLRSLLSILVLLIGIALLPVPYVKLSPGPVHNVLGEEDGAESIQISDTTVYPTSGELDMLTVTERGGPAGPLSLPEAYLGWLRPDSQLVPRDALYAPDQSAEEAKQISSAQFSQSESNAIAASLRLLGKPVLSEAVVVGVMADGPSGGKLEPDDVIKEVGGVAVSNPAEVTAQVMSREPGTDLVFTVLRDGQETDAPIELGASPDNPKQGRAGIVVGTRHRAPFPIEFGLEGIGGPSAGLVFSLGLIDKLSPESLTAGRRVAATGTVDPDGNVGSIGGVPEKLAAARDHGAEILLLPSANCDQLADSDPGATRVVPVETLSDAVSMLRRWSAGDANLPTCS